MKIKKTIIYKKNKKPFFTIITVVKNDEKNIERTIKSIKNQSFNNFEHIIIDGLSTDKTVRKVLKNKKSIDILISEKDSGIYYAMNKGILLSRGKIIVFVNSGDLLKKNALKIVFKKFKMNPNIDFVFGTVKRHYTKNTIIKYGFNRKKLYYNFDFATAHSTGFYIKKESLKKIGKFNVNYKCSADYDIYYRAIIKNKMIGDFTSKHELIGEVKSGGFSSKVSFLDHLLEESKIRIDNKQNIFFVTIIFLNSIIKYLLKKIKIN